jgi:phage terminase Nu1 subunit (DNA packaging protein)
MVGIVEEAMVADIAKFFSLDPRTVTKMMYGYQPDRTSGKNRYYLGSTVLKAVKSYYGVDTDKTTTLEAERIRLTAAQANRAELELDVSRGYLLDIDTVSAALASTLGETKAVVMNLPGRLAPAVFNSKTAREVEEYAKKIVVGALNELESSIKDLPRRSASDQAAASTND